MSIQIIQNNGKPEWAVVPYKEYLQLIEEIEMLEDIRDYDKAIEAIKQGTEELIPSEVVYALLDGENPIKVWREFRKLSQPELAEMAGISVPYLSQLETKKRKGSTEVLAALAKALNLTIDDLVET